MTHEAMPCLELEATCEQDCVANAVEIHLLVRGSSVFTGSAALQQVRELNRLVQALQQSGPLPPEDVRLQGIHTRISSGWLGKSSSAEYQLVIVCRHLERLSAWLGVITAAEQTEIQRLHWLFPETESELLALCGRKLRERAAALASGLGLRLGPLLQCREVPEGRLSYEPPGLTPLVPQSPGRSAAVPVPDFQLQQVRRQQVRLSGRFALVSQE